MNDYIVILSIGPVQSMIASARRSRDLWSGSWLLSELAKSCAKFLKDNGATLIFPFVQNDKDLNENSDFSVGNKIQVLIKANDKVQLDELITKAKNAVQERFEKEAKDALAVLNKLDKQGENKDIRTDIWQAQIQDFVEIQSAWAKVQDGKNGYKQAVELASKVLAARKATRDFLPSAYCPYQSDLMIPKSTLDGLRETVLRENQDTLPKEREKVSNATRQKLSLAKSEQLDAVGVIKRLGFGDKAEQFTPISRVMADAWIDRLLADGVDLAPIIDIFDKLTPNIVSKVTGNQGIYKKFPYDAQLLYKSRLEAKILEIKKSLNKEGDKDLTDALFALEDLKQPLTSLWQKYGQPYTYGALLLADGDRMGELLDKAKNQDQHQAITQALSEFAGKVADTMRAYRGHCIYAGGDDVLGFVPLDKAYQCADKLQQEFAKCLQTATDKLKAENQLSDDEVTNPTLSVGIAICHILTPLGVIRELADQAEKHAKGDHIAEADKRRNALGVLLSVRGGSDIKLRFNWHDGIGLDTFNLFVNFYKNKDIPSRIAYDIRDIYLRTHQIAKDNSDVGLNQKIQLAELTRMLKQARTATGQKLTQNTIDGLCNRGQKVGLDTLADELIVARWLAAKTQKDLGRE